MYKGNLFLVLLTIPYIEVDLLFKEVLNKLINKQSLSCEEASDSMRKILRGDVEKIQLVAFLTSLATKGEEKEEIIGCLEAVRDQMIGIEIEDDVVDTCGTGGDMLGSFNTSTAAAIVSSSTGVKVAKCGNRSSSSPCGSADLLEEVGIKIELSVDEAENWIRDMGFAFLFTPNFHPKLRDLAPLRKNLGVPTVFNFLGPLGNPVRPKRQLLGVSNRKLTPLYAELLLELGTSHSLVVHGLDGMDEISLSAPTEIYEVRNGMIDCNLFDPTSIGLNYISHEEIRGGDCKQNKSILLDLLNGKKSGIRDIVCVNAGATLMIGGEAKDFREGFKLAEEAIDSGLAKVKFNELVSRSKKEGAKNNNVHA